MRWSAFGLALALTAQVVEPTAKQANIDSFEYVWKTVRDKSWDPALGGLDWQAVHDEFLPRIEFTETTSQARRVLQDMLGRLKLSHFQIIPGTVYSDLSGGVQGGPGSVGIDVRILNGQAVVSSVDANSPAGKAWVAPGWVIRTIDGNRIAPAVQKFLEQNSDSSLRDLTLRRAVLVRLDGPVGGRVEVEFLDGKDQPVVKTMTRAEPKGREASVGYLGPAHVWLDTRQFRDGVRTVEYVAFNLFLDPSGLMPEFQSAVESCLKCDGFVIDLRGNPGGLGAMATGMAGWFVDRKNAYLGTLMLRDTALKFVINRRAKTFPGPLAILVDSTSASTSEILAGGLQDLKRARVFGTRTAAAALPSVIEILPNGDAFQFAIANYISEGGKALEGNGVEPDVTVPLTREALLAGKDPALDAALEWIKTQKGPHE